MANADMETTFATPEWTVPKDLEQATLTKLVEDFKDSNKHEKRTSTIS